MRKVLYDGILRHNSRTCCDHRPLDSSGKSTVTAAHLLRPCAFTSSTKPVGAAATPTCRAKHAPSNTIKSG